jgi:hypothetical protein
MENKMTLRKFHPGQQGVIATQGSRLQSSGKVGLVDKIVWSNLPGRWAGQPALFPAILHPISKVVLLVSLFSLLVAGYPAVQFALAGLTGDVADSLPVVLTGRQLAQGSATPALLLLNPDQLVTPINGGATTLTVRVRDAASQPVPGVTVQVRSTLGNVTPASVTTDGNGAAVVTFTAGSVPGQAQVVAETGGLTQEAAIQVVKPTDPLANTLTVTINASRLDPGQSLPMQATLRDVGGAPLAGELVSFFGSLGEVTPASAMTDADGRVTFTYRAGNAAGQAMITTLAGYTTASATIQVGDPAQPGPANRLFLPLVNR